MKALLTQSEKEILFKEFEESGKTYAQFSAEKGLNLKTFYSSISPPFSLM